MERAQERVAGEWVQKFFENPRTKAFVIKRPKIQQVHSYITGHANYGRTTDTLFSPFAYPYGGRVI